MCLELWEGERLNYVLMWGWKVKICIDVSEGKRVKSVLMRGWMVKICTDEKVKGKTCTNDRVIYMNWHNVQHSQSPTHHLGVVELALNVVRHFIHDTHLVVHGPQSMYQRRLGFPHAVPWHQGHRNSETESNKIFTLLQRANPLDQTTVCKPAWPKYCLWSLAIKCLQTTIIKVSLANPCYQIITCKPKLSQHCLVSILPKRPKYCLLSMNKNYTSTV